MDQYPPAPRLPSPEGEANGGQAKQNKLHALAFWEVGLIEIGFVAVVLLLLFGTLNYFNILSVSDVFPNQLGWLPRQQAQKIPQAQPKPTAQTDLALQKQKSLVILSENLQQSFIPLEAGISDVNSFTSGPNNVFVLKWEKGNASLSASFNFSSENKISSAGINALSITSLNSLDKENTTAGTFFKIPSDKKLSCQDIKAANGTIQQCSAFWQENQNLKKGIVAYPSVQTQTNQTANVVSVCLYYKESGILFESNKCIVR